MPGGDKRGPLGQGPLTGRRAGYCAGYADPGFANQGFANQGFVNRGYANRGPGGYRGGGGGGGRGFRGAGGGGGRRGFGGQGAMGYGPVPPMPGPEFIPPPVADPKRDIEILREQAEYLQSSLESIRKQLDTLTDAPAED